VLANIATDVALRPGWTNCQESTTTNRILCTTVHFLLAFQGEVAGTPIARWWDMRKLGVFAIRTCMRYVWLLLILSALASTR
jgi:hypothetical protein